MDSLSIIIPIFNEQEILASSLTNLKNQLRRNHILRYEIILMENGSGDRTREIATRIGLKDKRIRLFSIPGPNFGAAVRLGIREARFEHIFLFNIDWFDVTFIKRSLPLLSKYPIIIGSKQLLPNLDHRSEIRRLGSKFLTFAIKILFGFKGSDSHGIKAFRRSVAISLIKNCKSCEIIESELLIRAQRKHIVTKEIPLEIVEMRPARIAFSTRLLKVFFELVKLRIDLI